MKQLLTAGGGAVGVILGASLAPLMQILVALSPKPQSRHSDHGGFSCDIVGVSVAPASWTFLASTGRQGRIISMGEVILQSREKPRDSICIIHTACVVPNQGSNLQTRSIECA